MTRHELAHELVYVDEAYDRQMASDGVSRFGSYLRRSRLLANVDEEPLDAVEFAAEAWRIGCSPVMSPGYVRSTGRVHTITCDRGLDEPDVLVVEVEVRLPHTRKMPARSLSGWRDWHRARGGGVEEPDRLVEPDELAAAVLFTARLRSPIRIEDLPAPTCPGQVEVGEAKAAVEVVVDAINTHVMPAVDELGGSWTGVAR